MVWRTGILSKEDALAWLVWDSRDPGSGLGFCKALEPECALRAHRHLLRTVQTEPDTLLMDIHTHIRARADSKNEPVTAATMHFVVLRHYGEERRWNT